MIEGGRRLASIALPALLVAGGVFALGVAVGIGLAGREEAARPLATVSGDGTAERAETGGTQAIKAAVSEESKKPRKRRIFEVASVVDGDRIMLSTGKRVRLAQIDAPEATEGECYGRKSAKPLRKLLPAGTKVRLETDPKLESVDRYGRLVRYVLKDGRNLNIELVARGAASVLGDRGRYASELLRSARRAKAAGQGLWGFCPGTRLDPFHRLSAGAAPTTKRRTRVTRRPRTAERNRRATRYVVKRGDTLWEIAVERYAEPWPAMRRIKKRNGLPNLRVKAGQVLILPPG